MDYLFEKKYWICGEKKLKQKILAVYEEIFYSTDSEAQWWLLDVNGRYISREAMTTCMSAIYALKREKINPV